MYGRPRRWPSCGRRSWSWCGPAPPWRTPPTLKPWSPPIRFFVARIDMRTFRKCHAGPQFSRPGTCPLTSRIPMHGYFSLFFHFRVCYLKLAHGPAIVILVRTLFPTQAHPLTSTPPPRHRRLDGSRVPPSECMSLKVLKVEDDVMKMNRQLEKREAGASAASQGSQRTGDAQEPVLGMRGGGGALDKTAAFVCRCRRVSTPVFPARPPSSRPLRPCLRSRPRPRPRSRALSPVLLGVPTGDRGALLLGPHLPPPEGT